MDSKRYEFIKSNNKIMAFNLNEKNAYKIL